MDVMLVSVISEWYKLGNSLAFIRYSSISGGKCTTFNSLILVSLVYTFPA